MIVVIKYYLGGGLKTLSELTYYKLILVRPRADLRLMYFGQKSYVKIILSKFN